MNNQNLEQVRIILDALRMEGLSTHDIAARLALHQVNSNERAIRKWYAGTTYCRVVEFMALKALLNEVKK